MRVHGLVVFAVGVMCTPIARSGKRDLLGLFEGEVSPEPSVTGASSSNGVQPLFVNTDEGATSATGETAHHHQGSTTKQSGEGTSSTTLTTSSPTPTQRDGPKTKGGHSGDGSSTLYPTASATIVSAVNNDVSSTPPGELTQWKVIGISIICVTFVAIVVMAITFFDTWSAFVRDILGCGGCRKGRDNAMRNGKEDLVPDWDKRTWEFKLASEDGHRYPTMASLDSMAKSPYESVTELDYALGRRPSAK